MWWQTLNEGKIQITMEMSIGYLQFTLNSSRKGGKIWQNILLLKIDRLIKIVEIFYLLLNVEYSFSFYA